jgi:hypothetical protein
MRKSQEVCGELVRSIVLSIYSLTLDEEQTNPFAVIFENISK